ncbi:hypothetical protein AB0K00_30665 [Dactylosporangium sp. NPDC049525]|uniref:DODA-type extradiol aromatic ring-opening family dioxygenase n=1 Tax=Dactylosporangium sp. NPDC049525 TaxID=3154730 RepID=UPI00342A459A
MSLVLATSHSPFLYATPQEWDAVRAARTAAGGTHPGLPVDPPEVNRDKHARSLAALGVLRERLAAAEPDVLLVFGDDQGEQFHFANFPAFGLYVGESYEGYKVSPWQSMYVPGVQRQRTPKTPQSWTQVKSHAPLARYLMEGLVARHFDLAFSTELPEPDEGIGHAFMRPSFHLRPDYDLPTVPFFVNCYFEPQPTGERCYQLGVAVRELIDAWDADLRVAVIGSGGLWHTPGAPDASLNEPFDTAVLDAVRAGDPHGLARWFDAAPPVVSAVGPRTGMAGGVGSGSGEVRNWIVAAAVAGEVPGTVVDYVPVPASPCGLAFAYWTPQEGA